MFDRESAKRVDNTIQDGLFLMAVSNSCMNPLIYGSYAMKCRLWNRRRGNDVVLGAAVALQRRSTGKTNLSIFKIIQEWKSGGRGLFFFLIISSKEIYRFFKNSIFL